MGSIIAKLIRGTSFRFCVRLARTSAAAATAVGLSACASTFSPQPLGEPTQFSSYQTKSIGDIAVEVAVLTDEEAAAHFGVALGDELLQALWIRVRNASTWRYWLVRNVIDPDLYSPDEIALMVRDEVADSDFERMRQRFRDESIPVKLEPGTITQGFLFVPRLEGGRYIQVLLAADAFQVQLAERRLFDLVLASGSYRVPLSEGGMMGDESAQLSDNFKQLQFDFALTLPDGEFDYELLETETIYPASALPDLDLNQLRHRLEELPCCVSNAEGLRQGDPLNAVIVGESDDLMGALSRSGWSFTHRITPKSIERMVSSALRGETYPVAPVSSLYLFERKQDIALQRARHNISQRNHMRFWLAPYTYENTPVWIGQVSRDIGIKLTTHSPSLTTHVIDPAVDLTREYLLHNLLADGYVHRFGFVGGSTAATPTEPARNLSDDPYFSDGLRLVIMLSPVPVPYGQVRNLLWEQSAEPVGEGQTSTVGRNVIPIEVDDVERN